MPPLPRTLATVSCLFAQSTSRSCVTGESAVKAYGRYRLGAAPGSTSTWTGRLRRCCDGGRRGFHASRELARSSFEGKNHYERLKVSPDASPAEIKKSFYALSKAHHPDANRSDPHAAHNFSLISESYTVLSDASRRATYDRDAHEESTGGAASGSAASGTDRANPWNTSAFHHTHHYGGMGPGSDPLHFRDQHVPHFDKEGHTRTHERQDHRRWQRQKRAVGDDGIEFEPQTSLAGHFIIVAAILAATFLAPAIYLQFMRLGRQKKEKEA
ncbi:hypothetical protein TrVGV298_000704 [Trichoderma virens]|nr:hypothetical protein TrVGV298_000704 [Trichoderma virens]